jgi:hypothetical protein
VQDAQLRLAEPSGVGQDCVEHGLEVSWRAGDDAQDLRRRRQLLERRHELAGPRLQEFRRGLLLLPRLTQGARDFRM